MQRPRVELYSHAFLRKYIHYAKNRVKPQLTDDARELIASYFNTIRQKSQDQRAMPVTARMLETLIRLSTAHAKVGAYPVSWLRKYGLLCVS